MKATLLNVETRFDVVEVTALFETDSSSFTRTYQFTRAGELNPGALNTFVSEQIELERARIEALYSAAGELVAYEGQPFTLEV